ncbi:imidazolonepropionase-like amidohydrolase [Kordia periserrulae]|uniref:Imidazolonepropionase-like amidohydrolase n=1 Tax=Kordia periserrulae TaxID=701523 RepID=A0A2T6C0X9_9FLAO|nr:amidohydrolase family protein [Kordia periserrulae]PTX61971.1 imidazolonepropionase-like amidohydrolase [Kordia periserrulae]
MKNSYLLLLLFFCSFSVIAQDYFPKNDGVKTESHIITAFTNAKIYVTPTQVIENGTLLIQDGKVLQAGSNVSIPKSATVVDLAGKSIYPSFIDPFSDFGIQAPKRNAGSWRSAPQYDAERKGYYWNDHIRPDVNPIADFTFDNKKATDLLKAGFGTVNTHMHDGIVRGNGLLVALNTKADNSIRVLDNRSAQYLSYKKSNTSKQAYPTSLMGSMALLRQMYHDADWYAKGNAKRTDLALEALLKNKNLVQIFHSGNKHNSIKTDAIGDEFGIQYVLVGDGTEYENINAMKATNASFIIPLDFPKAYDVSNPYAASVVELEAMKHWNQAPSNPKMLADKGIQFSFTMHDSKSGSEFMSNIQKAISYGLDKTKALEALTTVPAKILQQEDKVGTLQNGRQANFIITSGDIFDKKTVIYENWVQGNQHVFKDKSQKDLRGKYTFNVAGTQYDVDIAGTPEKLKATVMKDSTTLGSKISFSDDWLQLHFTTPDTTKTEFVRLTAPVQNVTYFSGRALLANGSETTFNATQKEAKKADGGKKSGKDSEKETPKMLPISYPNGAYGMASLPQQEDVLFKNATVWTNEKEGILKNTDVLVKDGKIARIGQNLNARGAKVIDATGKHLTAGIIDEHSHIAAFAINEAGHNSTAEVNMADVVNPEDVDIYRNLAGGVTTIQLLHGSANPIGGRSAILSLRWGRSADEMLFKGAPGFIKFALGENVKQSNWGDTETTRFPQTRMGVEQVFTDYFQRAKEYEAQKKSGNYRYDIEMETILEIINKERFVSCHSYVQSEINMLMKVAEKYGFNINTFTHILEGYKVADKMEKHGVGGSTFSDWWAYKYEVNDAIPYNAAIMHSQGVVVAINSDDGEMSRRLNQEAAKTVKYGGVSEEEAWKFVTLNPAKLLHIDDKVGSIKTGKQADLVLWTNHPMSIYAKAQTTMIEGTVYFDLERDAQLRKNIQNQRSELMNMMLLEKNKGMKTLAPKKKEKVHHHCDTVEF